MAKTTPANEANAKSVPLMLGAQKVYGIHIVPGIGYRNNGACGTATCDEAETQYMVVAGAFFNGNCCFDYGNMERNSRDNGEGTMEAVYFGKCTTWNKGDGDGPWVMGDLENGLWAGDSSPFMDNKPITSWRYVTGLVKGESASATYPERTLGDQGRRRDDRHSDEAVRREASERALQSDAEGRRHRPRNRRRQHQRRARELVRRRHDSPLLIGSGRQRRPGQHRFCLRASAVTPRARSAACAAVLAGSAAGLLACSSGPSAPARVTISVDATAAGTPLERVWAFHGYDEINYTTTPEGSALLGALAAAHTAPVHVRSHFLLNTGDGTPAMKWGSTNVYTEDAAANPVYDWTLTDGIIDTLTGAGALPFVELGFMPEALSTHPTPYRNASTIALNGGCFYPPTDYTKWAALIRAWATHASGRYSDVAASWLWELWNEPDSAYWHGTFDEYAKLYDYTESALHQVIPDAPLGGPAVVAPAGDFLTQFLAHCATGTNAVTGETGTRLDLVTFHAKGGVTVAGTTSRWTSATSCGFTRPASAPSPPSRSLRRRPSTSPRRIPTAALPARRARSPAPRTAPRPRTARTRSR